MRKTNKALALFIATVMVLSLFSFLTLTGSAAEAEDAPVNLALNAWFGNANNFPGAPEGTLDEQRDFARTQFPRVIAINGFSANSHGGRLINGNTNVDSNTERWTMDAGNDGARGHLQALYAMAFPGATWIDPVLGVPAADDVAGGSMNIWVGIDFGVPTNFNEFVFYETNPHGAGQGANPLDRRIVGEFVIEVSNNPEFVPDLVITNPFGSTENPGPAYANGGAFNTTGWTEVYRGFANATVEGFAGGPTVASFPELTTAYRYVRLRTISTLAQGRGHVTPNFTQIQVFNQPVEGAHVPVTGVTAPPATIVVDTPIALDSVATPANATNPVVNWTVVSGPATIVDGSLTATGVGSVVILATVENGATETTDFTQEFTINVVATQILVESITVPAAQQTGVVGTNITLNPTMTPADATITGAITWALGTGSTAAGAAVTPAGIVSATGTGTVVVVPTAPGGAAGGANFDGTPIVITFTAPAATAITGIPTTGTVGTLNLTGTVVPAGAGAIVWTVQNAGTTGAIIAEGTNVLTTTAAGTVTVRATVGEFFVDTAIVISAAGDTGTAFVPVTGITGVPTSLTESTTLTLTGTVAPTNATNSTIVWSVVSGPATITGNVLTPTGVGIVRVRATIANGTAVGTSFTDEFYVTVNKSDGGAPKTGEPIIIAVGALAMVAAIGGYAVMMKKKDSANV